jgi:hypothetical protein
VVRGSAYAIPTCCRTDALVSEHPALQATLGCAPSVYACYRFAPKLRAYSDRLDACIGRVTASLRSELPELGGDVSIDASDLPAFGNGGPHAPALLGALHSRGFRPETCAMDSGCSPARSQGCEPFPSRRSRP